MPSKKSTTTINSSRGGKARANVLTPEERRDIARQAARARWAKAGKIPSDEVEVVDPEPEAPAITGEPPYSMFRGTIDIGDVSFEGHVLSDGRRVLTQREVVRVISGGRSSGALQNYLRNNPLYEDGAFDDKVIPFKVPHNPQMAIGYEAELLVELCDLYLQARDQKLLKRNQLPLAQMAEIVVRACAKVGIIALIDEATGYQKVRAKRALQMKLQAFIAEDMQEWAKLFPDEFWFELARLEGIHYSPRHRPLRWGKYVMAFVYDAVDGDVGNTLREINPNPHHRQNHHQWLKQHGREQVNNQIQQVIAVMRMCDSMADFRKAFDKVFSRGPLQLEMSFPE